MGFLPFLNCKSQAACPVRQNTAHQRSEMAPKALADWTITSPHHFSMDLKQVLLPDF
jgi:hypothetical protein